MRWHDYTHRGNWTHSCLYDDAGTYLAQCWPHALTGRVQWETASDSHRGEAATRGDAKRAVRRRLLETTF